MTEQKMLDTPMLDRMTQVQDSHRHLCEFIRWLQKERGIKFFHEGYCAANTHLLPERGLEFTRPFLPGVNKNWFQVHTDPVELADAFFGIDRKRMDEERLELLKLLQVNPIPINGE